MTDIKEMNITEKLNYIQVNLKAPKSQRNKFGNLMSGDTRYYTDEDSLYYESINYKLRVKFKFTKNWTEYKIIFEEGSFNVLNILERHSINLEGLVTHKLQENVISFIKFIENLHDIIDNPKECHKK